MKKFLLVFYSLFISIAFSLAQAPAGYYDEADGLSGDNLKSALHTIISRYDNGSGGFSQGHVAFSYSDVWEKLMYTDEDPDNTSNVILFYTGWSYAKNNNGGGVSEWNREHTWAKSHGDFGTATGPGTDLHHLRPTDVTVNGARSNLDFDNGGSQYIDGDGVTYCYYDGDSWEPWDEVKGDVARIIFYMAVRYEGNSYDWNYDLEVVEGVNTINNTAYQYGEHGNLSTLLQWHQADPVSDWEMRRNNRIFEHQKNRNPFIDHPEYVNLIWGDGTPEVSFSSTPATAINAGEQYNYSVTAIGGNGSPIEISCTQKPAWLSFSGGSNGTASLSGIPAESDEGEHSVVLAATDGESAAEQSFTILVSVVTPEIIFTSTPVTSAIVSQQYSYTIEASVQSDESQTVSFDAATLPEWLTLTDNGNGTAILYGTPTLDNVGVNGVEILATTNDLSKTQTFDITVSEGGSGGDWVETFTLMPETSSSYTTREWTGDNGIEWSATNARTDQEIDGRAICLKDAGDTYLISQTLAGGVSSVTFEHQQKFSGSGGEITLFVNDQQIGESVAVSDVVNSSTFSNINISGDFTIKLVSNGATRIAIDNLGWTNLSNPPQSPVFGDILHTPESPLNDEEVTFLAEVTDADGTIEQVLLSYGSSAETLSQSASMQYLSGNSYSVSLQLPLAEGDVYYAVEATDNDGNVTVSPTFVVIPQVVNYLLTINIVGEGLVEVDGVEYASPITAGQGSLLNLVASPLSGYQFDGWSGDLVSAEASQVVTLTDDLEITASFSPISSVTIDGFSDVKIFPNPFTTKLSIDNIELVKELTLFNMFGQQVLYIETPSATIDVNGIANGVYVLKVIGYNNEQTQFIVVKK